ncbi:MAG: hypothetical protein AUJ25_02570 [Parcubacteria group bacterium CG1_02_37_13]|nr:MAG: hypothetical protein AUJ25_02570 [Parcubacteria group bacterium CG1_02_37_13]
MVAWWTFDETSGTVAKDNYFNQLHGTVSGTTWVKGIVNNALSFDGNDYVAFPLKEASNVRGTFEEWVKPAGWNGGDGSYQGSFQTSPPGSWGNGLGQMIIVDQWSTTFYFRIVPDGGCCPIDVTFPTAGVFSNGTWTHIVATWDKPTNTVAVYINGKLKVKRTNWTQAISTPFAANVYSGIGNDRYYRGSIDEVRLYSTPLPLAAIQQHYAAGLANHQPLAYGTDGTD